MLKYLISLALKIRQIYEQKKESHRWRRLQEMGMQIGKDVALPMSTFIDTTYCFLISIGDRTRFGPNCVILAHDATMAEHLDLGRIGRVSIGKSCSFGFGTIILPGVTIGDGVVSAAYSVITRNMPPKSIIGGNPARRLMSVDAFASFHKGVAEKSEIFSINDIQEALLSEKDRREIIDRLKGRNSGYIKLNWERG